MKGPVRTRKNIYDKLVAGAILMLAAELFGPVPVLGEIFELLALVL